MQTGILEEAATARGIGGVGLIVRDIDRVAQFYRDVIGLAVSASDGETVRLGDGGLLELRHRPAATPRLPGGAGLFHTAFLLPDRPSLGRFLGHLAATGHALDGAADHLVSEAVYLHDPEGNGIEVYADRPRAGWQWDGPQLRMANARLDFAALRSLDAAPWTGAPPGTRVGHVHLSVGDSAAAGRFYAEALGLRPTVTFPEAAFLAWDGYHHHLAANTWNSAGAGPRAPGEAGLAWVALSGVPGDMPAEIVDPWGTVFRAGPATNRLESIA